MRAKLSSWCLLSFLALLFVLGLSSKAGTESCAVLVSAAEDAATIEEKEMMKKTQEPGNKDEEEDEEEEEEEEEDEKVKPKKKKKKKQYNEVVELMGDIGGSICNGLAKMIKDRKNFKPRRRCDLFIECIEDLGSMTDAMVKELDMTQQDMVNTAQRFPHFAQLQMNLKKTAKSILAKKQPSEKVINEELNKDMSQWILNVATGQNGHSSGLDKLPRDSLKGMRAMGIRLPSYGILDDDEMDTEDYLLDESDKAWAHQADIEAEDDDDDDEDDD